MKLSVLAPFRPDYGHRDRAWAWTKARWEALIPEAEIVEASDDRGRSADPGQFSHALAINRCAEKATGDIFLMLETCFDDPEWVRGAVRLVEDGAPWVLPSEYHRLTEAESEAILSLPPDCEMPAAVEPEWIGESWAGMVVYSREKFEDIGGYDNRFTHWGAVDVCFAMAMNTLHGEPIRHPGRAVHFWHPAPLSHTYGNQAHRRQHALMERYVELEGDAKGMRALIAERP